MKECCQSCKLRYEAHQTDFRKLGTDEPIDSIIDDAFICMAFAYEGIANLMIGADPKTGFCEAYTPIKTEPQTSGVVWTDTEIPIYKTTSASTEPIDRDELGDCNICKYVGLEHRCNQCVNGSMFCKVEDEPQTELVNDSPILVKDLVDDEFNPYDEECMRCMHLKLRCEFVPSYCHYEPRDEPHHSGEVTEMVEPQTDGYMTAEQTVDCAWK